MTTGIYVIVNLVNHKRYVGSAVNIKRRWNGHRRNLRQGIHENPHLQKSWNKHGEHAFEFDVLEIVQDKRELTLVEQYYLDWMEPEYNICRTVGSAMLGRHHTEETKRKISAAHIGKPLSEEHRAKLSASHMGQMPPNKGKHYSAELRAKLSAAHKGLPSPKKGKPSPLKGRSLSVEHRANLSMSGKAAWVRQKQENNITIGKRRNPPCACGEPHYAKGLCRRHYRKANGYFKKPSCPAIEGVK
jgi:group I intron endonuclease